MASNNNLFIINIAFVGQEFEQGMAGMACLCSMVSGAQLGRLEGWDKSVTGAAIICRLLHLHIWARAEMTQSSAQLGLLMWLSVGLGLLIHGGQVLRGGILRGSIWGIPRELVDLKAGNIEPISQWEECQRILGLILKLLQVVGLALRQIFGENWEFITLQISVSCPGITCNTDS